MDSGLSGAPVPSLHPTPPPSRQQGLWGASPSFMRHFLGFHHCHDNQRSSLESGPRERPMLFCPAWTSDRGGEGGQAEQVLPPREVGASCFCCDQETRRRYLRASQVG